MAIQFGKLVKQIYSSSNGMFNVYQLRCGGGRYETAIFVGDQPPKALKTVEYQLQGRWENHPKYGQQFLIETYQRSNFEPQFQKEHELLNRSIKAIDLGRK